MALKILPQVVAARTSGWAQALRWVGSLRIGWRARPVRQLRLRETLPLGERRFLAVVEFERQKFLIGGTANSVNLLTELGSTPDHEYRQAVVGGPAAR